MVKRRSFAELPGLIPRSRSPWPRGRGEERLSLAVSGLCVLVVAAAVLAASVVKVPARMVSPTTLAEVTESAARIFRGRCVAAETGIAEIAGARIPVTTYVFQASEHLKGVASPTITFRQVGSSEPGPRDLGRLVGLPVYNPGVEYVLFLLPQSKVGLTSPAGAGEAAFLVSGSKLLGGGPAFMPGAAERGMQGTAEPGSFGLGGMTSYSELRQAVLEFMKSAGETSHE